jgi:hypothetical protein
MRLWIMFVDEGSSANTTGTLHCLHLVDEVKYAVSYSAVYYFDYLGLWLNISGHAVG